MYVCKECHDTDRNSIGCTYEFDVHAHLIGSEFTECEICGKKDTCVFCDEYQAEIMIVARIREWRKKNDRKHLCGYHGV